MSKIKVIQLQKTLQSKNDMTKAILAKYMTLRSVTIDEIATNLNCSRRTIQNKLKRTGDFYAKELRIVCLILHIPEEEKELIL